MAAVVHPNRPPIRRNSPLSISNGLHGFSADAPMLKRINIDDSDSDDEPPPAIKFSKVTQALLADTPVASSSPSKQELVNEIPRLNRSVSANRAVVGTPSRSPGLRIIRRSSPAAVNEDNKGSTPARIVQISTNRSSSAKRSMSTSVPYYASTRREPTPTRDTKAELITPAPGPRAIRVRTRANSATLQDGQGHQNSSSSRPGSRSGARSAVEIRNDTSASIGASSQLGPETVSRYGSSTLARSRNTSADPVPPPGSQRVKRAPIGTGSFLKSGPVRRGFRRRDSEEDISPHGDAQSGAGSQPHSASYMPHETSVAKLDDDTPDEAPEPLNSAEPVSVHDFAKKSLSTAQSHAASRQAGSLPSRSGMGSASRPQSRNDSHEPIQGHVSSIERPKRRIHAGAEKDERNRPPAASPPPRVNEMRSSNDLTLEQDPPRRAPSLRAAQHRYAAPRIHTDASEDQENMPPPTFKRNKDQDVHRLGKPIISILSDNDNPKSRPLEETPVPVPAARHERKVLGAVSNNTPHRAAPAPPPKMSVIDTVTSTAGASVTKSKKKRSHIVINGKIFTQMGHIGSGGSSRVYCVMAENYKTFALKRVKLSDCDESAVRGYKGEIDLLKKLTEVDRVVRLFDWELNEDKKELCVLMEKGDADLNHLLMLQHKTDTAKFDPVFTRYYWREMLECVAAVHAAEIVHSDLKPANFLLVAGRLKLIDFGIANAIDTDHTVNVHRDTHVGTPNYMSPESITDTNAAPQQPDASAPRTGSTKKDMRIGKPSDVWSLGCILYQMTYGRPPFAHIPNQLTRILAITNPSHTIPFPATGLGNVLVPSTLKATLRKCLDRDPERRPLIRDLLAPSDPWMFPEREGSVMVDEDLLGQIIAKVVARCGEWEVRGWPGKEELALYPGSFLGRIREMVEKG